jgi:beta-glucosidase
MKSGADGFIGGGHILDELVAAAADGRLGEPEIFAAAARVDALSGHVGVTSGENHEGLELAVAREAVVLLRNDGLLPLLVGPGMRVAVVHPGRSCGLPAAVQGTVTAAGGTVTVTGGNDRVRLREADSRRCLVAVGDELGLAVPTGDNAVFDAIEWSRHVFELSNGRCRRLVEVTPARDRTVKLRNVHNGQTVEDVNFVWEPVSDGATRAAEAAAAADVALVVIGNDGVATDRESLLPPAQQDRTLRAVRAANPNTVLVVLSSHPYALDWAEANVAGIVWSAPGRATDTAVAEVLFGERSPAGRLPQTWYRATDTAFDTYLHHRAEPLFPFGHGLSYGRFTYADPTVDEPATTTDGIVTVSVEVTNVGDRAADEVVQLYLHQRHGTASRPVRELKGFQRVALAAGESRTVSFRVGPDERRYWNAAVRDQVTDTSTFDVWVGGDSTAQAGTTFEITK